jgi:hypothetical protein
LLALLFLSYLAGAAVMFFQLPSSGFLSKSFMGVRAWGEKRQIGGAAPSVDVASLFGNGIDRPGQTYDGYTLCACASLTTPSTQVFLVNMNRDIVHHWQVSFSKIWPNPPHLEGRQIDDSGVSIFACHLYPNGDLLVVFHGLELHARGYGLAKLDKDSKVIWSYAGNVHHDIFVGEEGVITTLTQRTLTERPKGLEFLPAPWSVDHLVRLSADGKELHEPISLLDALRNSPYAPLLSPLETPLDKAAPGALTDKSENDLRERQNVLHANSVCVLSPALAAKFPMFRAGQVLVTMRNLHAIAVFDPSTGAVVWGTSGPWRYQHDAQFLGNGRLLVFDNLGSPHGSRVLEYDPSTGAFPWVYPGPDNPPFFTPVRGMAQRLPNGNTLVVNSQEKEMFEVTAGKELVWSCGAHAPITTARRYGPAQVTFLNPRQRPRP